MTTGRINQVAFLHNFAPTRPRQSFQPTGDMVAKVVPEEGHESEHRRANTQNVRIVYRIREELAHNPRTLTTTTTCRKAMSGTREELRGPPCENKATDEE